MDEAEGLSAPLPCDVVIGHINYRKGVQLRTLVDAATRWHATLAARAESRSTPDREEVAGRLARFVTSAINSLGLPGHIHSGAAIVLEEADDDRALLARPASSAGGVEEATRLLAKALEITDPLDPQLDTGGKLIACRDLTRTALAALTSKGADRG